MKFRTVRRLLFIFRPTFYVQNNRLSIEWDELLNEMLDNPEFTEINRYTVKINGRTIWVSNYPYAYGSPYGWAKEVRPRRDTIVRLKKAIDRHFFRVGVNHAS